MIDAVGERHFSGFNTRMLVEYLTAQMGAEGRDAVLELAGETRILEVLGDDATWSSYEQVRRLLEATSTLFGIETLSQVALVSTNFEGHSLEGAAPMQALGSPAALLDESAASGTGMGGSSVLVAVRGERIGPCEYRVGQRFKEGFEPFAEWCVYFQGLLSIVPMLFGLPQGEVVEDQCQCRGDPACIMRLRWDEPADIDSSPESLRAKMRLLETQLSSLRTTVADLVSPSDIDETLASVAAAAARTLRVPAFVLALENQEVAHPVTSVGLDTAAVERVLASLESAETLDEDVGTLVVPLASAQRPFGHLIVVEPGRRFRPHERDTLLSFASLAAIALDSASTLIDARRQATTANALLVLARSLADISSSDEMAAKLARAVPAVIDCDRSAVLLVEPACKTARIAAVHGYTPEVAKQLIGREVPDDMLQSLGSTVNLTRLDRDTSYLISPELRLGVGSIAAASLPILVDRMIAGYVVAIVAEGPHRLEVTPDLEQRLQGLAAQGSTAICNARLLDEINHQALHDTLTGLPNRALVLDRVDQMLRRGRRSRSSVGILFVDLDGFKDVNDTFGHEAGDRLLQAVGVRLSSAVRARDSVGRLGGDEFVVLVESPASEGSATAVAGRILSALQKPFKINDETSLAVSASIGVAIGDRETPSDLLRDADVALYEAKGSGKHRAVVFRPEMAVTVSNRLQLEMDLQVAIAEDQFFLLFQPILDLSTERVTGVEALLRWQHPERGVVMPDDFIPLLEQNGMIVPVGGWVLLQACRQAAAWTQSGRTLEMSVNISARQLESESLVDFVGEALGSSGLDPSMLILEITETSVMTNVKSATSRLSKLKKLGVRVAIDDFGTGYSSLAHLPELPIDILKIDRSFVATLDGGNEAGSLVRMLVHLGKTLRLKTVAEGIERESQLCHLRAENCESGQGFLFARPLDASAIESLLVRGDPRSIDATQEVLH